jgi:hypothetical protein
MLDPQSKRSGLMTQHLVARNDIELAILTNTEGGGGGGRGGRREHTSEAVMKK